MAIRVALNHKTNYRYDRVVQLEPHIVRLRPAPHCRTPILSYSLRIEPAGHFLNWQQDPYSNYLARLVFIKPARDFLVEVDLVAELSPLNPFDFFIEPDAEHYPFVYDEVLARELIPYLETLPAGPKLKDLVESVRQRDRRTVDFLVDINRRLQKEVRYVIRMEPGVQTCEETLTLGRGSCRDSAWLLVQVLRHLGLAARFVSGYLIQLTADEKSLDGPSGPEQDFTDLHAWAEVYLPGAGWVGLDPTSGLLAGEGHLPLACAADPTNAAPITGSYSWTPDPARGKEDKCEEEFRFHMSVTRIHEVPRVTKPYTEEQWHAIDSLGHRIDEELRSGDVRLTMGGEPTFVSIDDRDSPEWNTMALSPATALAGGKRRLAGNLLLRLHEQFAPGGLLHFGQGKWYPGESLPRWTLGCYWRRDRVPMWKDPALIAEGERDHGHGPTHARLFATTLAELLGVDPAHCVPGYEDVWYYLWRERRLPVNVDPLKADLDDPEERRRLARVFEQKLGTVVGYALPLRAQREGNSVTWESGPWFIRTEHLFLIPGDSPMGYRLPLDALPWEAPEVREAIHAPDPFAPHGPLPLPRAFAVPRMQPLSVARGPLSVATDDGQRTTDHGPRTEPLVRTAMCVEPREGRLHVFMPPVACLEDYLDLVTAIETTAAHLRLPVRIEGYKPPSDPRLNHFQIMPDPGVIEVNIHPSHSWDELVHNTSTLYEEARQARLSTEKFLLDGRHCGTGGGNHIVIGGPTPADSPILRRPDLLRSLLTCWHNHPSLSYLFSCLFVGPTSQAPRVDEARNDSLYEMELGFGQVPTPGVRGMPWLVDRLFRNLLIDVTGNTHRAEFCIDKLYSPDTSDGRRGLVELRAFEMPPHPRMSLVQHLLLRALIAWFWKAPLERKLVRWGTELHDRFMLPHFVEQDFEDLLQEMSQAGYPLETSWFAPHLEFRFPFLGSVVYRGVHLELRQAIEPWHVLGEEPAGPATARYVDSSVERLEIKVRGLTDTRHVVTCNRRRIPLHPTGITGEFVAGVRYRAWQPPSCLHPTIPVHTPLVFDVFDTWTGRSIGGCQYHVSHPGGLAYEVFPINAGEAESRRRSRFFAFGHTPAERAMLEASPIHDESLLPEFPLTLDLRQPTSGILPSSPRRHLWAPAQTENGAVAIMTRQT
jgi:uncharacterized protein (DUF2126 family)/transglutaminase-like putative cysteine protease